MSLVDRTVERLGSMGALAAQGTATGRFKGLTSVTVSPARLTESVAVAKEEGFDMISDIFGIDYAEYPRHRGKRFSIVYNLLSTPRGERLFLRVDVDDGARLPSITALWKAANFMEREVFDMFGIEFDGHPDLRKLITPEDLDGHPHRKDFPIGETPTLFNDGRFLDPAAFRAGLTGKDAGLTGWKGGTRKGVKSGE